MLYSPASYRFPLDHVERSSYTRQLLHDALHEKTDLKVFLSVIPKEGLTGYDTDYKILLYCLHRLYSVVGVIPKEGLAGPHQSFFGYDNDKGLKVLFLMTRLTSKWPLHVPCLITELWP